MAKKDRPRYRHIGKDAKFLGNYNEPLDKYDLYFQSGQLVARFSDEPPDYLMSGSDLAIGVAPLRKAMELAEKLDYKVVKGCEDVLSYFTTSELIVHATEENKKIYVKLTHNDEEKHFEIRANEDGSISLTEKGSKDSVKTCTKDLLIRWPESLGEVWLVQVSPAFFGGDDDDDDVIT